MRVSPWNLITRLVALLLGLLFFFSAVAKLVAIDSFEVYLFSFGFFSLNLCYLLARFCIVLEFVLSGSLLTLFVFSLLPNYRDSLSRKWRIVAVSTLLLLLLFSIFLGYVALVGRTDNCQCMGQWINLTPVQSLLKNALLVVLTLLMYYGTRTLPQSAEGSSTNSRAPQVRFRRGDIVAVAAVVAIVVAVFTISLPDNWLFGSSQEPYNQEVLEQTLAEVESSHATTLSDNVGQSDRRLVAFFTPGCPYCQLAKEKLDAIQKRHHLDDARFLLLYPETIGTENFLRITYGNRPLVLLLEGDSVVATYHFRNIDEKEITEWLR